ncbi:MAG: hypothetical protein GX827_08235 [Clostridiales bacterium]|nr:hypothetical protein [Clostridiales bacterium]
MDTDTVKLIVFTLVVLLLPVWFIVSLTLRLRNPCFNKQQIIKIKKQRKK